MFNSFINIIYNFSILAPFLLAISIVEFINKNYILALVFIILFVVLFVLQINIQRLASKKLVPKNINVTKLSRDDNSKISLLYISYLGPFLQLLINKKIDIIKAILILVGILLVVLSHKGLDNPILKVMGFKTYNIETEHGIDYILLSKRDIRDRKTIRKVFRLTENRLMECLNE